ncbi:MAG: hypothetical protein M3N51_03910 [Actinomycetota bacterium]|nr:hypothetical protein [Actinomycetota bacterium]
MEIPREVADAEGVPEDLDASVRGPYQIPSPRRRRISGFLYLMAGAAAAAAALAGLPTGLMLAAALLGLIGLAHLLSSWELRVRERRALEVANRELGFPIGHASATLGFRGWRSRPVWNVLVFSAEEPPARRGLVRVDAVDGQVVGSYVEDVPTL